MGGLCRFKEECMVDSKWTELGSPTVVFLDETDHSILDIGPRLLEGCILGGP